MYLKLTVQLSVGDALKVANLQWSVSPGSLFPHDCCQPK